MSSDALLDLRHWLDRAEIARLSVHACPSRAARRRHPDPQVARGHRQEFQVDADRVLHSLAYTRYIDKTQVFSLVPNDHITHRVLHVQLVSKIARGMGRVLGLNEDLIEAIALAHDLGHPPFGHDGERFLSAKCREHGLPPFLHNVQSLRFLERLEKNGRGLNLSLQVLDGVLTHDGEVHSVDLVPQRDKNFAAFDAQVAAKEAQPRLALVPMTLEGCVVRVADTVSYIGRDLEDAVRLGLVSRAEIPAGVVKVLGNSNGTIVYKLVDDLLRHSLGHDGVAFSPEVALALGELKRFNYERIYLNPAIKTQHAKLEAAYHRLFDDFLADLEAGRQDSPIIAQFLGDMDPDYRDHTRPAAVVRDYLAGMTDKYFLKVYGEKVLPRELPSHFGLAD